MAPVEPADGRGAGGRVPRVLCLTGTASGKRILELQLSRLFREAKDRIEFVIYEGERDCTMAEAVEIMSAFFKGLPMKMYDEMIFDERNWRCYKDVRGTLQTLQKVLKEQGPFDGVLGFSQGANFSVMLAAQSFAGVGQPLSFAVAMCPNAPGYVGQLPELFEEKLQVPALVVRGAQEDYDEGVKKTLAGAKVETLGEPMVSEHTARLFQSPQVWSHPDGHRPLPTRPQDQAALCQRIIDFILESSAIEPVVKGTGNGAGAAPLWRVGDGAGGRVVRKGCGLGTEELSSTLRPGALVEEVELRGSRLRYRLVSGAGPETGWVTVRAKAGELLHRLSAEEAGLTGEIWILTMGTRGDLQPFVVLGRALQEAGYAVRLFGPPELANFSQSSGLRFTVSCAGWSDGRDHRDELVAGAAAAAAGVGAEAAADGHGAGGAGASGDDTDDAANEDTSAAPEVADGVGAENAGGSAGSSAGGEKRGGEDELMKFVLFLQAIGVDTSNGGDVGHLGWLFGEMPKTMAILSEELANKKPDLLIYNHLMVNVGQLLWRRDRIRTLFANLGMEFHFAPSGEDIFNYRTLSAFDRFVVLPRCGVSPVGEMTQDQFTAIYTSPDRLLGTTRLIREVLPLEAQAMSKEWRFTGFWVMESDQQFSEPSAFGGPEVLQRLKDFLASGAAPVYFGWGSMPTIPRLLVVVVRALQRLGLRGVIVKGWGYFSMDLLRQEVQSSTNETSEGTESGEGLLEYAEQHVLFVDKAPHEWLFPRCACTVHHGGAGTTAAALRAGVPTVVVPVAYDQFYHGDWVVKLGVGVKTTKHTDVGVEELEAALRSATSSAEMRARAQEVAETLKQEPGVAGAVAKIREVLRDEVRSGVAQARWEAEEQARVEARKRRIELMEARRAEKARQKQAAAASANNAGEAFKPPVRA